MSRRFKTMGLALTSLLAIGAVFASSALAQFQANAEKVELSVKESQPQEFQVSEGGLTVVCNELEVEGTQEGKEIEPNVFATQEATVHPTYSDCEPLLGQSTEVDTNACNYVFHLGVGQTTGTTDVECAGAGIEIHVGSLCTYEVGTQEGLESVTFANETDGTLKITPDVHGIESSLIQGGFLCPAAGDEGTYKGSANIQGNNGTAVISVD